ncbi:hypothetical protein, partial [Enterococcus faecium]|uniref:hypothetical protein n=1 Tax=Enterococcus faecium TaxID=1352 RepID=UPI001BB11843
HVSSLFLKTILLIIIAVQLDNGKSFHRHLGKINFPFVQLLEQTEGKSLLLIFSVSQNFF